MKSWFVYIIRCTDGSLYTGCTNHVIRRWKQHKQGKGAKYLQAHIPRAVVFVEEHPDRSKVCKREFEIKQFTKRGKESLEKQVHLSSETKRKENISREDEIINPKKTLLLASLHQIFPRATVL